MLVKEFLFSFFRIDYGNVERNEPKRFGEIVRIYNKKPPHRQNIDLYSIGRVF